MVTPASLFLQYLLYTVQVVLNHMFQLKLHYAIYAGSSIGPKIYQLCLTQPVLSLVPLALHSPSGIS